MFLFRQRVPSTQLFIASFCLSRWHQHSVDWEVLEPSSSVLQTDALSFKNTGVSATSPSDCLRWKLARKNPVLLRGDTGLTNVVR